MSVGKPWRRFKQCPDRLAAGDQVCLVHEETGNHIQVEVGHLDSEEDEYGGTVQTSNLRPFVEPADHVHFEREHVKDLQSG